MIEKNIEVLRKILYAVETGGQVYGRQRYDAFIGAGANTPNEKAITIGAGQWYAGEAKRLLQEIQRADPTQFKRLDTQGIADDLLHKNWSRYAISPNSAKAKCIIKIISSPVGIKSQDKLMETQIEEYSASIGKAYGSMPDSAMMECINIIHQGGVAALKRILAKAVKPYTSERIYAALCTDPADKSNNNQVGDYTTRQKKVIEMIRTYAEEETDMTAAEAINAVIGIAEEEIGYLEKRSNRQLDSKTANAGSGNYTKVDRNVFYKNYTKGEEKPMSKIEKAVQQMEAWAKDNSHGYDQIYRWGEKGDYDCSAAVIQACQNAGIPVKTGGATYTGNMLKVFLKNGFEVVTHEVNLKTGAGLIRGDVLLNTSHHTAMYCGNGKEVEASINEKGTATGGKPGDQTGREFLIRSYRNYPWTHVLRYTKDTTNGNTGTTTNTTTGGHYMFEPKTVKKGDNGLSVLLLQEILIARGFKGKDGKPLTLDRAAGTNTIHALTKYQESRKGVLEADGICGDKTWRDLIAL